MCANGAFLSFTFIQKVDIICDICDICDIYDIKHTPSSFDKATKDRRFQRGMVEILTDVYDSDVYDSDLYDSH